MLYGWITRRKNRLFEELLAEVAAALEARDIEYWLDWGTLLGAWRDGQLLTHDTDVDLAVPARFAPVLRDQPLEGNWITGDHGDSIYLRRRPDPCRETLLDLVCLQIYFVDEHEGGCRNHRGRRVGRDDLYPLSRLRLGTRDYPAPARPGLYLEALYGYTGRYCVYLGEDRYRACHTPGDYLFYWWNHLFFYRVYFYWKAAPWPRALKARLQNMAKAVYTRWLAEPKT